MDKIYRLGILSDTHLTNLADSIDLAEQLRDGPFDRVDAVLHAGDMVVPELECCFGDLPFYVVQGNMDAPRAGLPRKRLLELAGFRIGLVHGWGAPAAVPFNARDEFATQQLDLIVFGHSHTPFNAYAGETLLFNPGSATDHRGHAEACTVGLIELGSELKAGHVFVGR